MSSWPDWFVSHLRDSCFLRQVDRLALHTRVTIAECDSDVHRAYFLKHPIRRLLGGGDTDFRPVFDHRDRESVHSGIVYFTDGKGRWPERSQSVPVLWVLTNDDSFACPFGHVVRLPVRESELWDDARTWF